MLTVEEAKHYLRVDFKRDDALLEELIRASDEYLIGAVGKEYDKDCERSKMLQRIVVQDLYDNRELSETVSTRTRQLISDFALQLRIELSGKGESDGTV